MKNAYRMAVTFAALILIATVAATATYFWLAASPAWAPSSAREAFVHAIKDPSTSANRLRAMALANEAVVHAVSASLDRAIALLAIIGVTAAGVLIYVAREIKAAMGNG